MNHRQLGLFKGGWLVLGAIVCMHLIDRFVPAPPSVSGGFREMWDVLVGVVQWSMVKLFR